MDELMLAELCRRCALGEPLAPAEPVSGGLLHRMYRLQTTQGRFAVKVLSPIVMQYADVRENFRLSERIARAIVAAGLPAITALECVEDVLQDVGLVSVMVFPWVEAHALSSAGPLQTYQIGSILGRIHTLPLRFGEPPRPGPQDHSEDEADGWAFLVEEAEQRQITWAGEVRPLLPQIAAWICSSEETRQALGDRWVISHGDLDRKNVLWSDENTPWLIDWESAGHVQPAIEAVGAALDWSGQAAGALDAAAFQAFLTGYRREVPLTAQEVGYGLHAYCGNWCGWLKFSMQRSLGLVTSDPEEQALGIRETFGTLALLRSAALDIPDLKQSL